MANTKIQENTNIPDDLPLTSGFRQYPKHRNDLWKHAEVWLRGKREVDDVGSYWRIHDKLYDLSAFIQSHPGGSFWIEKTRGTDITELFESSHFGPMSGKLLRRYFIKDVSNPRNSPFTFHEDGFYQTLKRKVSPIIAKVGKGPTFQMMMIQDSLFFSFLFMFLLAGWYSSIRFSIIAGMLLSLAAISAHNFFHQKDNWRMYIFDMMLLSSKDWRISHVFSHHVFPNTIYDYEISSIEPYLQLLPRSSKTFMDRYGTLFTFYLLYCLAFFIDVINKIILTYKKECRYSLEDLIIVCQIIYMVVTNGSILSGFWLWLVVHLSANFTFLAIGLATAHHHPDIYREGDATTKDKDWGLLQVSATREKGEVLSSLFLVAISFGNHTLHHLFPTVDHSKLPLLMPALLETCKEFGIKFELFSTWKHYKGFFSILAKNKPNPDIPCCFESNVSKKHIK